MRRNLNRAAIELRRIVDGPNGPGRNAAAERIGVPRSTLDNYLVASYTPSGKKRSRIEHEFPSVASKWWDEEVEEQRGAA